MSRTDRRPTFADVICAGKVAYATAKAADRGLKRLLTNLDRDGRERPAIVVYRCSRCALFHTGNADPERTAALADEAPARKKFRCRDPYRDSTDQPPG